MAYRTWEHSQLESGANLKPNISVESYCRAQLVNVWQAHYGTVPSMKFFGRTALYLINLLY
jgi:hypothetical protein